MSHPPTPQPLFRNPPALQEAQLPLQTPNPGFHRPLLDHQWSDQCAWSLQASATFHVCSVRPAALQCDSPKWNSSGAEGGALISRGTSPTNSFQLSAKVHPSSWNGVHSGQCLQSPLVKSHAAIQDPLASESLCGFFCRSRLEISLTLERHPCQPSNAWQSWMYHLHSEALHCAQSSWSHRFAHMNSTLKIQYLRGGKTECSGYFLGWSGICYRKSTA